MLYKLDDYWIDELKKAAKMLNPMRDKNLEPSDIKTIDGEKFIDPEDLLGYIEELDYELDHVKDELRDTIQDMEDNCVRRSAWEDSGMSYHDFI